MKRISDAKVAEALKACAGKVTLAAEKLGYAFGPLYRRIRESPELQEVLLRERESLCDVAEIALKKAVIQGEAWAVCFALKCQGKDRGYVERPDNVAIAISTLMDPAVAAAMIEQ